MATEAMEEETGKELEAKLVKGATTAAAMGALEEAWKISKETDLKIMGEIEDPMERISPTESDKNTWTWMEDSRDSTDLSMATEAPEELQKEDSEQGSMIR